MTNPKKSAPDRDMSLSAMAEKLRQAAEDREDWVDIHMPVERVAEINAEIQALRKAAGILSPLPPMTAAERAGLLSRFAELPETVRPVLGCECNVDHTGDERPAVLGGECAECRHRDPLHEPSCSKARCGHAPPVGAP